MVRTQRARLTLEGAFTFKIDPGVLNSVARL
jgi:hypothetical protein